MSSEEEVAAIVEQLVESAAEASTSLLANVSENTVVAASVPDVVDLSDTILPHRVIPDAEVGSAASVSNAFETAVENVVMAEVHAIAPAVVVPPAAVVKQPQQMSKQQECLFCHSSVNDVHKYGEFIRYCDISKFHYKCLLTASGLIQRYHVQKAPIGLDDDGAVNCRTDEELQKLGFAYNDIRAECKRACRLTCKKCGKKGACNGCSNKKCEYSFHLPCAIDDGCFVLYADCYPTYCSAHVKDGIERYKLKFPWTPAEVDGKRCMLCCEDLLPQYTRSHRFDFLQPTCCRRDDGAWYIHRHCAERQVHVAGQKYAKCPNCNQNEPYIGYLKQAGVFVLRKHPDYLFDFDDSSDGEEDEDAFEVIPAELLIVRQPAPTISTSITMSGAEQTSSDSHATNPTSTLATGDGAVLQSHAENLPNIPGGAGPSSTRAASSPNSSSAASLQPERVRGGRRRRVAGTGAAAFVDDEDDAVSADKENGEIDDKEDDTLYRPYDQEYSPGDDRRRSNRLARKNSFPMQGRSAPTMSAQKRKLRPSTLSRCAARKDEIFQRIRVHTESSSNMDEEDDNGDDDELDDYDESASDASVRERRITRSSATAAAAAMKSPDVRRRSSRTKRVCRYVSDDDEAEVRKEFGVEEMLVDEDYSDFSPRASATTSPKTGRRVTVREESPPRRNARTDTIEDETAAQNRRRSTRIAHWREKRTAAEANYKAKVLQNRLLPAYKRKLRLATLLGKFRDNNVMQEGEEINAGDDVGNAEDSNASDTQHKRATSRTGTATRVQTRARCSGRITAPQKQAASEEGQGCKRVLRPRNLLQSPKQQQQPTSSSRTQRYNMRRHDQIKNYAVDVVDVDDEFENDYDADDVEYECNSVELAEHEAESSSADRALVEH